MQLNVIDSLIEIPIILRRIKLKIEKANTIEYNGFIKERARNVKIRFVIVGFGTNIKWYTYIEGVQEAKKRWV